mgnify:CR=1 FL=1
MKDIYQTDFLNNEKVTPLQGQVLHQYQLLAVQLNTLNVEIDNLISSTFSLTDTNLLDNLRNLEIKINLIHTLFKSAVYSLFTDNNVETE